MQAATRRIVNYVLYTGGSESDANSLAQQIFGTNPQNGVLSIDTDTEVTNVFLRWTGGINFSNPIGVTDILIVHVPSDCSTVSEIETYVEARSGIPVRIVLSTDEGLKSWEQSNGFRFTNSHSDVRPFATEGLSAFDNRLQGAFSKHDTDGNGINKEQFAQVAQELGVDTSSEAFSSGSEVNFSTQSRLPYSLFRQWYIFGRNDTELWTLFMGRASQIQAIISEKLSEISKIFETVSGETTQELSHRVEIDLGSTHPFNESSGFGWEILTGSTFDTRNQSLPYNIRSSPFTLSFEIGVNDQTIVDQAVSLLTGFKEMAKTMVPTVALAVKMGVDLQFRSSEGRFYFDLVVSGLLGGIIQENISRVNFHLLQYSGFNNFSISTQFSPLNLLNNTLEEILRTACFTSISSNGEVVNTKTVLRIVHMILSGLQASSFVSEKDFNTALGFLNAFKGYFFKIKYDPELLFEAIRNAVNIRSTQNDKFGVLSERWTGTQAVFTSMVEQGKMFAGFVADYVELLKNINLDNINLTLSFPVVRTSFRVYLKLKGISGFINENFLA